jgi:plastocyanin
MNRNILIRVSSANSASGKAGTFTHPPPKVKLDVGDTVTWDPGANGTLPNAFQVRFQGFRSPFQSGDTDISNNNNYQTVANPGVYHYSVKVTIGGVPFTIEGCPEFDVP